MSSPTLTSLSSIEFVDSEQDGVFSTVPPGLLYPHTLSPLPSQGPEKKHELRSESPSQAAFTRSYHFEPATIANFEVRETCCVNSPPIIDDNLGRLRDVFSVSTGSCWTKNRICSLKVLARKNTPLNFQGFRRRISQFWFTSCILGGYSYCHNLRTLDQNSSPHAIRQEAMDRLRMVIDYLRLDSICNDSHS